MTLPFAVTKSFLRRILLRFIAASLLSFLWTSLVLAQESGGWGQGFVAPGATVGNGSVATLQIGLEGGFLFASGVGFNAGLGYLAPMEDLGEGIGAFSPGASFTFRRTEGTQPFFTGGYTLFFRSGTAHGLYFGGGINHWFSRRLGIRLEGRDQVVVEHNDHFLEFRVGFLFR